MSDFEMPPCPVPGVCASCRRVAQSRQRAALADFAQWLVSLDDEAHMNERRTVSLGQIIGRARAALGGAS